MCRLHHKGRAVPKRCCKVRQGIYEKVGSKVRKHIVKHSCLKIRVEQVDRASRNRCAESTTRGRRGKVQVEQVDRASMKN